MKTYNATKGKYRVQLIGDVQRRAFEKDGWTVSPNDALNKSEPYDSGDAYAHGDEKPRKKRRSYD